MFLPDTNYVKFCFVIIIWYIVVLLHNYIAQVQLFYSYMEFSSFKKKAELNTNPTSSVMYVVPQVLVS